MPAEHKRHDKIVRRDIVRLIVTTRERFPHTPQLTAALRRVMWRYVARPQLAASPRKRRAKRQP